MVIPGTIKSDWLLRFSPSLLFITDVNGVFLSFSGDPELLYSAPEDFMGKTYFEILPKCVVEVFTDTIKAAIDDAPARGEYPLAINKELYWYEVVTKKAMYENEAVFIHAVSDITERKLLELKLVATAKTHRLQFEDAITSICWCDVVLSEEGLLIDFVFSSVNAAFYHLFAGEAIGQKMSEKYPGEFEFLAKCQRAMRSRHPEAFEHYFKQEKVYCYISAYPISETQLNISFVNITSNKKAEKALLEAERLNAVGELAFGVAHDFNNSLQIILGNLELAITDKLDNETQSLLAVAKGAALDAAARVQQLQRIGHQSSGERVNIRVKSLLDEIILQARPLWKDAIEYAGHSIVINKSCNDCMIHGVMGEIRSTLFNILKNGIEAMPSGGALSVSTGAAGDMVYIRFADTGIGMTPDIQKKIFQPFFSTKGFEKGRGLGLAAAYAIIREHGGEISVDSIVDVGTTITILLPAADESDIIIAQDDTLKSASAHILWVDDEKALRTLGARMIASLGHSGDVAESGIEALHLLRKNKYDIMITDIGMSGMNGWQLIEKIDGNYPEMKVIVLSGWGDNLEKGKNVDYMLGKPIEKKSLEAIINDCLTKKD